MKKEYTFVESLAWHWKSRKFRSTVAAMLTVILVKSAWFQATFGIKPEDTGTIVNFIMMALGLMIASITGEKYVEASANGKDIDSAIDKNNEVIEEMIEAASARVHGAYADELTSAKESIDAIVDEKIKAKVEHRLDRIENETHIVLDELEKVEPYDGDQ